MRLMRFIFKDYISVAQSLNTDRKTIEAIIVAKKESDIEDLINCANLVFGYDVREKNYNIFKNSIDEVFNKEGKK